ncbi:MAG: 4Fe-4S binding protein [Desulfotomaculaceae bacterium]|nr:4Fe-4S binding protein [Desulfotomaculaceae bacterium]
MKRSIVRIDEEKCTGCGICVTACQEGALRIIDGKAKLVSESYCDGLGACLPECPAGAIEIEEREADAFDEEAVKKHLAGQNHITEQFACGCAGTQERLIQRTDPGLLACGCSGTHERIIERAEAPPAPAYTATGPAALDVSQLRQWPCQIKLVGVNTPYFDQANLLVAADCTAYAYANIHNQFMRNKITLIGCPKLDNVDYTEKLTAILKGNDIKSITVLRMGVPCCAGMANAVKQALINSGKMLPWQIVTITTDGKILEE